MLHYTDCNMDMFAIKIYGASYVLKPVCVRMLILKSVILCTQQTILTEISFCIHMEQRIEFNELGIA